MAPNKTERDLQWPQVLESIAGSCLLEQGVERLLQFRPLSSQEEAEVRHDMVRETMWLHGHSATLPLKRFAKLDELWTQLGRRAPGSAEQLRDLGRMIAVCVALRTSLKEHAEHCPTLERRLWTSPELQPLGERIRRAIDDTGEILDSASAALREARGQVTRTRKKLRDSQQVLLKRYGSALSGQFFAERDGRLVLPVRTDMSGQVPGLVLGSSASGSTLYVEPRELTEPNNKLRVHEAEVAREEARVLSELSEAATDLLDDLRAGEEACIVADCTRAIALWGDRYRAFPPRFSPETLLWLKQFRHPLLLATSAEVVPNDIKLAAGEGLVISGPNAGGKTVAMKCLGLAVLMTRSGLPLPADADTRVGWFEQVFTNIGDEQSLSRSLSTFSAHIENVAHALSASDERTLVLLDELAGGTDPEEGAALAVALMEAFVEAGAAVAVTTHYEKLKELGASTDPRFINASVGFDMTQLRPTFHLAQGTPGASSAFVVAERYGVPSATIHRAKALVPENRLTQEQLIAQLEEERQKLNQARLDAEAERDEQTRLKQALESERRNLAERERARLQKEAQSLTADVKEARTLLRQAKTLIGGAERMGSQELRAAEALVNQAAEPITLGGSVTQALRSTATPDAPGHAPPTLSQLSPGTRVHLIQLNTVGEVVEAKKEQAIRVSVGGLKLSVPLAQLRLGPPQTVRQPQHKPRPPKRTQAPQPSAAPPVRTVANTCDLRGVRVEEGLEKVDQFIDQTLRNNEASGFVLHGHGTGAMKAAVREHLSASALVAQWEPAPKEDGGDALTLFWLRG